MKFTELTECPFCGCEEFCTKQYVYGTLMYRERFDGEETENCELYDSLNNGKYSGNCYCLGCNKLLGNKDANTVSKQVEKRLQNEHTE